MKRISLTLAAAALAAPVAADEARELGAHQHGLSELNIAIEGNEVAMELHAPGADIVGFEHPAESDDDKAAVEAALDTLSDPLALFVVPEAAGCSLTSAEAKLESEAHGEDHEHEEEHAEAHEHDEEHAEALASGGHAEFHAEYAMTCSAPDALTEIAFAFFDAFPSAREVEVQLVTETGAQSFEVERGDPVLGLGG